MLSPTPQVRLTLGSSNQPKFELVVNLKGRRSRCRARSAMGIRLPGGHANFDLCRRRDDPFCLALDVAARAGLTTPGGSPRRERIINSCPINASMTRMNLAFRANAKPRSISRSTSPSGSPETRRFVVRCLEASNATVRSPLALAASSARVIHTRLGSATALRTAKCLG